MAKRAPHLGLSREVLINSVRAALATLLSLLLARILLGAHLDHCHPALHHRSADARVAALRRHSSRCDSGRAHCNVLQLQLDRLWRWHFSLRNPLRALAPERRLALCRDYLEHRASHRAHASALDRRHSPLLRSIAGHCRGPAGHYSVAGTGTATMISGSGGLFQRCR
jgi:hypothetical protein